MTKAAPKAPKPKDVATITYHVGKEEREAELHLPVGHGRGEALLNRVEREGCTDINAVRAQIQELPHVNAEDEPRAE